MVRGKASQVQEVFMRPYDTVIVLRPDVAESKVKETVERLKGTLVSHEAEIIAVEEWGMRELAYPVKKQEKGISVIIRYRAETPGMREFERQIKFTEDIIRYITIRLESEPKGKSPENPEEEPGSQAQEHA
jgi:small subunit ribosomal protein S6